MSSGIFKQAATSMKPHDGVGGLTNTKAFGGREGSDGEGAFGWKTGDLPGIIHESRRDLPLGLEIWFGLGISPAAITSQGGCSTLSHPTNFGVLSLGSGFDWGCDSGMSSASGTATPGKPPHL